MFLLLKKMLRTLIAEQKLVFILFCICQIVSILSMIFVSGVIAAQLEYNNSFDLEYRQFSFLVEQPKTAQRLAEEYELLKQEIKKVENCTLWFQHNDVPIKANISYQKASPYYVDLGRYFSAEEFKSNKNLILINQEKAGNDPIYEIGDKIIIGEKTFKIIGAIPHSYFEIPFNCLTDNNKITQVEILLQESIKPEMAVEYAETIKEIFGVSKVSLPEEVPAGEISKNLFQNISILLISLLAICNFSFLYRYLLKKRQYQYAVFRLCGCSSFKGSILLLLELLIVSFGLYLACAILFHFGLSWIYPFMTDKISYALGFADYIEIALIYLLNLLVVFVPIIRNFSKKSPIQIYREV